MYDNLNRGMPSISSVVGQVNIWRRPQEGRAGVRENSCSSGSEEKMRRVCKKKQVRQFSISSAGSK